MLERVLVAFEAPTGVEAEDYEVLWDEWVGRLHTLGLRLVSSLDPVDEYTVSIATDISRTTQLFEVTSL